MKVENLVKEKKFQSLEIVLTIESVDELNELYKIVGKGADGLTGRLYDFLKQNGASYE